METLDLVIELYANATYTDQNINPEYAEAAKKVFKDKIIDEINQKYKLEIRKQVKAELEEEYRIKQNYSRIRHIKTLLIESILVAIAVGLLVNQATDLITYFKENREKTIVTLIAIAVLCIVTCVFFKCVYMNKVENEVLDYFNRNK